jgi:hypothetical protein
VDLAALRLGKVASQRKADRGGWYGWEHCTDGRNKKLAPRGTRRDGKDGALARAGRKLKLKLKLKL